MSTMDGRQYNLAEKQSVASMVKGRNSDKRVVGQRKTRRLVQNLITFLNDSHVKNGVHCAALLHLRHSRR